MVSFARRGCRGSRQRESRPLGAGRLAANAPHADTISGSRYANLKELRVSARGRPIRIFFAFDPRQAAIVLIGGDKTNDPRFYDRMIPIAEELYQAHLEEIEKERNDENQVE